MDNIKKGVFLMSFQDIFKSNFIDNVTSVSLLDMLIAMILAFGLGIFIFLVYKKTYNPNIFQQKRRKQLKKQAIIIPSI